MGALLNRRRYMGGGSSLPYDAEIKYLESVGNGTDTGQIINSDVLIPASCTHVEYHFKFAFTANHKGVLCGHQNPSYQNPRTYLFYTGGTSNSRDFYAGNRIGSASIAVFEEVDGYITLDEGTGKLDFYRNNSLVTSLSMNGSALNRTYPIKIFGGSVANNLDDRASVRIWSFSIIHGDSLVRDFIPVRVGTVGYMFDRVSGQLFGNAGTGDFVLGPDKYTSPYDAEIEYLGSNGNCVINTGYIPTGNDVRTLTKVTYNGYVSSSYVPWFTAYTSESADCFRIIRNGTGNNSVLIFNGTKANGGGKTVSVTVGETYTIELGWGTYTINGTTGNLQTTPEGTENTSPFVVFADNFKGRFYYFQVYKASVLVLDLIPVRVDTTGYMYDRVSGTLFGNTGTGNFTLGPDKT